MPSEHSSLVQSDIKAIAFDAVGTLIYAMPSVSTAYSCVLRDICGAEIDATRIRSVLATRLSERTEEENLETSEDLEYRFWKDLSAELVDDKSIACQAFQLLYDHFALADNWCAFDDVAASLETHRNHGRTLLLASNFDQRLHAVKRGRPELNAIEHVVISSEVGWRKPSPKFFQQVCEVAGCKAEEILFVGDDIVADVEGAIRAGMISVWLNRHANAMPTTNERVKRLEVSSLAELLLE